MSELTMYTTVWCGYCRRLKLLLDEAGIGYREIDIEHDPEAAAFVPRSTAADQTVPTVVLPDGRAATNPTFEELRDAMAA